MEKEVPKQDNTLLHEQIIGEKTQIEQFNEEKHDDNMIHEEESIQPTENHRDEEIKENNKESEISQLGDMQETHEPKFDEEIAQNEKKENDLREYEESPEKADRICTMEHQNSGNIENRPSIHKENEEFKANDVTNCCQKRQTIGELKEETKLIDPEYPENEFNNANKLDECNREIKESSNCQNVDFDKKIIQTTDLQNIENEMNPEFEEIKDEKDIKNIVEIKNDNEKPFEHHEFAEDNHPMEEVSNTERYLMENVCSGDSNPKNNLAEMSNREEIKEKEIFNTKDLKEIKDNVEISLKNEDENKEKINEELFIEELAKSDENRINKEENNQEQIGSTGKLQELNNEKVSSDKKISEKYEKDSFKNLNKHNEKNQSLHASMEERKEGLNLDVLNNKEVGGEPDESDKKNYEQDHICNELNETQSQSENAYELKLIESKLFSWLYI